MIVMKFGGTSMGTAKSIREVAEIVKNHGPEKPVVVVSAMSGITDSLIDAANAALTGKAKTVAESIEEAKKRHMNVLEAFANKEVADEFFDTNLLPLFDEIELMVQGIRMLKELSLRSLDSLSSFGERLSSYLLAFALNSMGVNSERFDTRDILRTDSNFGGAHVDFKVSKRLYRLKVLPLVNNGGIPILTGFIGADSAGNTTTLGRGGSDYSASIAAILLGSSRVEIWTDVDGILTANPREIEGTKLWKSVSFQEAAELAYSGAKVLHPKTIHPAIQENIDVLVKNTFNPSAKGTLINQKQTSGIKGITTQKGVNVVYICSDKMLDEPGFVAKISTIFNKHDVSIDVITTSEVSVSVSVNGNLPKALLNELKQVASINVETEKAKLCLVGTQMCSDPAFLAEVFSAIRGYHVHMISFGASNVNLTMIVEEKDVVAIARKLHGALFK